MCGLLNKFIKDDQGATMVEYGLMLALIAIICMAVIAVLGRNLDRAFGGTNDGLATAVPGFEATP